ncbi:MAG: D-alanyl-D-alanine carboxypeptidase [Clostridia bacterium]|nr:D-alanyl-D-alanine carboxypeptidase [Clostridia bacterium]
MYSKKQKLICFLTVMILSVLLCVPAVATSTDYDSQHPEKLNIADLQASAAILIEKNTGMVVFEKNADRRMFPASTTKIMTVYLGLLLGDLHQKVTTTATSLMIPNDSSTIPLAVGEEIIFEDLLYATMVKSGNEGANLIAETIAGNNQAFADLMNQYAVSIGCTDTHFTNPHGLHDENHYTTARDMALIAREAMQNENFRSIAKSTTYTLPKSNIYRARSLTCRTYDFFGDPASAAYYEYANGIKTGNTSAAGHCFVGSAEKDGVEFISVVFYTPSYKACWSDTKKLMEYGFTQYVRTSVSELYQLSPKVLEIAKYDLNDESLGQLPLILNKLNSGADDSIVTLKNRVDYLASNFNDLVTIEYVRDFVAPITAGELMGTLTYYPEVGEPIEYQLIASRSIKRRILDFPTLDEIINYSLNDENPFPRFTVETLALLVLIVLLIYLLVKFIRRLLGIRSKKTRRKVIKPITRYYR